MEQLPSPHPAPTPPTPYEAAAQVIAGFPPAHPRARIDGWTPERQRQFCEALADCGIVRDAAAAVGMTPQSAYSLKRRPEGKGFALAWAAALLLARPRLIDVAIERAVDGNTDTYIKDGEIVGQRRKQDVRHLLAAITKLEHVQNGDMVVAAIADDFDEFLDSMVADAHSTNAAPATDATSLGRKRKAKVPPSPLQEFFKAREFGPGMEGNEFDAVLGQLSYRKALPPKKCPSGRSPKTANQGHDADDIWSNWDSDPFDSEI